MNVVQLCEVAVAARSLIVKGLEAVAASSLIVKGLVAVVNVNPLYADDFYSDRSFTKNYLNCKC